MRLTQVRPVSGKTHSTRHRQLGFPGTIKQTRGWRITLQNLGIAALVGVLHGDDHLGLGGVGDEVHGATHALDLAGQGPRGQVAKLVDLHGAEDGQVDAAAADHAE